MPFETWFKKLFFCKFARKKSCTLIWNVIKGRKKKIPKLLELLLRPGTVNQTKFIIKKILYNSFL